MPGARQILQAGDRIVVVAVEGMLVKVKKEGGN